MSHSVLITRFRSVWAMVTTTYLAKSGKADRMIELAAKLGHYFHSLRNDYTFKEVLKFSRSDLERW